MRRSREGRQAAGFTLIEILIVVTIIVMMFGLAMPTLSQFMSNQKLKAVTGRLASSLCIARTRAITKHQTVYAFFLADQLMVVSSRLEVPEFYPYFSSAREASKMAVLLRFADARVEEKANKEHPFGLESDLAPLPEGDWTDPATGQWKAVTGRSIIDDKVLEGKSAYLAFQSDGTVQFGRGSGPGDRLSVEFWTNPPRDADIVVEEQGNALLGWIDVRATGNVDSVFKEGRLKEVGPDEEGESE